MALSNWDTVSLDESGNWRGPQNGVYAVVWVGSGGEKGIVAAGVYGYQDGEWVGVKQESVRWFADKLAAEDDADDPTRMTYTPHVFQKLDWAQGSGEVGGFRSTGSPP
jgi:hypothetical protein